MERDFSQEHGVTRKRGMDSNRVGQIRFDLRRKCFAVRVERH